MGFKRCKGFKKTGFIKRLLAFMTFITFMTLTAVIVPGLSMQTVSAKQITGTINDEYRKSLEDRYGYRIIIDDSVKEKNALYTFTSAPFDVEFKILKDIETAFVMLPDGLVKEVNDCLINRRLSPSINVRKKYPSDIGDSAGWFNYNTASINIITDGNDFIRILIHELGHEITYVLRIKNKLNGLDIYFDEQNGGSKYPYNENYNRLFGTEINDNFKNAYLSIYSSKNFSEDFAETFAHAVMQPRYISSFGGGVKKAVHNKIEMMSETITGAFDSVRNSEFLLRCMPDPPAEWAAETVKKAKEKGIVPWDIYGLNNAELTRYDAALILQPFLYKYIDEAVLLKTAKLKKDMTVPEDFVYDLLDGEDVVLLHNLRIIAVSNGRFNPDGKIQRQSAAIMLTKIAQMFGLSDNLNKSLTCKDAADIADWAKAYVKFAVSLNIMSADTDNNFNPERYITYQELYASLLNLCNLKEEYNRKKNIKPPSSQYIKTLGRGTALSSDGWIYHYNYGFDYSFTFKNYTGKGKEIIADAVYEGDFVNGVWHGRGKIIWSNGLWYEGDWVKNERTGKGTEITADAVYEGDFIDGIWTGKGKMRWADGSWYDGDWVENERTGKGKYVWTDGSVYEGYWKNGLRSGRGRIIHADGSWYDGDWVNDSYWNSTGRFYINGAWYDVQVANGAVVNHKIAA